MVENAKETLKHGEGPEQAREQHVPRGGASVANAPTPNRLPVSTSSGAYDGPRVLPDRVLDQKPQVRLTGLTSRCPRGRLFPEAPGRRGLLGLAPVMPVLPRSRPFLHLQGHCHICFRGHVSDCDTLSLSETLSMTLG